MNRFIPAGQRKLSLTIFVFVMSIVLLLCKQISADNLVSITQVVIPAFLATNLVSKFIKGPNTKEQSE